MNIGQVLEFSETHGAFVYLKAPLTIGETINWLHTDGTTSSQKITHLTDAAGRSVERMVTSRVYGSAAKTQSRPIPLLMFSVMAIM